MIQVTIHYAKTHLSRLLKNVAMGETVLILRGDQPVARLVAAESGGETSRPRIGEPTSSGVTWTEDAFSPMEEKELDEWGL
jgi:antitoxin (DNA-binding transcriptional repressor) of toxin-antitoxin stability system